MKEKIFVVPAQGLTVIDPADMKALPPEGKEVDAGVYWTRRLADGDVTIGKAAKTAKSKE